VSDDRAKGKNPYDRPSDPAKRHSAAMTDGPDRAPARAMLKAIGFTDEDLAKPIIGVATTWIETMPCNYNQRELADAVKRGIRRAGGTPMEFGTISVSDGVAMGTEGMKASLISRDLIADSIELVAAGHSFDGIVCLTGCDKTSPGAAMALGRLNIPGLILYNGTILPGSFNGKDVTVQSVFEAVGASRERRLPRTWRVRRTVHRKHDEHGDGGARPLPRWPQRHPCARPRQDRSGGTLWRDRRTTGAR
jgi:dihydroxyacid dehydratase/phosphogluconate dehydratase